MSVKEEVLTVEEATDVIKATKKWYSSRQQSTYNRIFNFVVGIRGGGKTFSTIKEAIEDYIKKGTEFIYLRRRQVDLDDSCNGTKDAGGLFADIINKGYFEGHELTIKGSKSGGYNFYFDGKIMGYGKALSTAANRRSTPLPKVNKIIFDEFLIDDSKGTNQKYLNNGEEMFLFANFYETIARGRDIPVFFLGNSFSMVNPYFLELNIRINDIIPNKIYKGKSWTLLFWKDEGFLEERAQTQFFQAMKGSKFTDHAFGNTFYLDNTDFLKNRTLSSEHMFSLEYLGNKYGVWYDEKDANYYVSKKGANTSRDKTISLSLSDNSPNNVNIRKYRNMAFMKLFRMAADNNSVYFDTQECYNQMNEVVYLLRTIN